MATSLPPKHAIVLLAVSVAATLLLGHSAAAAQRQAFSIALPADPSAVVIELSFFGVGRTPCARFFDKPILAIQANGKVVVRELGSDCIGFTVEGSLPVTTLQDLLRFAIDQDFFAESSFNDRLRAAAAAATAADAERTVTSQPSDMATTRIRIRTEDKAHEEAVRDPQWNSRNGLRLKPYRQMAALETRLRMVARSFTSDVADSAKAALSLANDFREHEHSDLPALTLGDHRRTVIDDKGGRGTEFVHARSDGMEVTIVVETNADGKPHVTIR